MHHTEPSSLGNGPREQAERRGARAEALDV
jgi:hypothetical protein